MPLVTLDRVHIAYGHLPLVENASLQIEPGERLCLIGRNGTGKTTLLRVVSGELAPDTGQRWVQPGIRVARLEQDVPLETVDTVFDVVAEGLGDLRALVVDYHHAATAVARDAGAHNLDELARLQHRLEERDGWRVEQQVETVLARLGLPADVPVNTLSGGWRRRALLARALVAQPELLILDEPTNHLDIEAITWLESTLADYPGAILFVTHDRAFLERLATRILELDRGQLTSWPGDYRRYLERKEAAVADEATAREKFDKKLAQEEAWLRRGVKARRTRDEGRVRALLAMRDQRARRRSGPGHVSLQASVADQSGRVVFDADAVTVSLGGRPIIRDFSCRVMRGDRIGLIGPNGSGKTTMLRLLVGELPPDRGEVRVGTNVQIAYFDQQREQLDPERALVDIVGEGSDVVTVDGQPRHVVGYLGDFLFPPERARSPVKALSGGERNRLLLARLFTRPANVLVLDEPTNDLDLETLELLEALLVEWHGTILLVSHDRRFLDNVVTSTLVFEGDGRVDEFVGGYADWERQHAAAAAEPARPHAGKAPAAAETPPPGSPEKRRLSYNEQRELAGLPARIAALEAEQTALDVEIHSPEFYKASSDTIAAAMARRDAVAEELLAAYARWDELDSRG
jgi:ATP-binding cassette subfamily F protein uup